MEYDKWFRSKAQIPNFDCLLFGKFDMLNKTCTCSAILFPSLAKEELRCVKKNVDSHLVSTKDLHPSFEFFIIRLEKLVVQGPYYSRF